VELLGLLAPSKTDSTACNVRCCTAYHDVHISIDTAPAAAAAAAAAALPSGALEDGVSVAGRFYSLGSYESNVLYTLPLAVLLLLLLTLMLLLLLLLQVLLRTVCLLVVASTAWAAMRATCSTHSGSWSTLIWGEDSGLRYQQVRILHSFIIQM
jgi:hypothetical protein